MNPETQSILTLTESPYDQYNANLLTIKQRLGAQRVPIFESVLVEELPLTTVRRAFRTAIQVAMGEEKVYREIDHQKPVAPASHRKNPKKSKK